LLAKKGSLSQRRWKKSSLCDKNLHLKLQSQSSRGTMQKKEGVVKKISLEVGGLTCGGLTPQFLRGDRNLASERVWEEKKKSPPGVVPVRKWKSRHLRRLGSLRGRYSLSASERGIEGGGNPLIPSLQRNGTSTIPEFGNI